MSKAQDLAFSFVRTLTDASALPAFVGSVIGKHFYLRTLKRYAGKSYEEIHGSFSEQARSIVNSGVSPAGGYMGVWCRDASYILEAWMQAGLHSKAAELVQWIWDHQITVNSRLIHGRGSPRLAFRARVAREETTEKFVGALPTSIHRAYREVYGASPDIDSTALMVKTSCMACTQTNSESLANRIMPFISRAIDHLQGRDEDGDGLLEQGENEDWMDSVMRAGKVVYSQAVWLEALNSWSDLLNLAGKSGEADRVHEKAKELMKQVDVLLWNGSCYADRLDGSSNHDRVNQDIAFYLEARKSSDQKALKALESLKEKLWKLELGPHVVYPPYERTGPLQLRELDYQNGAFWPWIASAEVHARISVGQLEDAELLMTKIIPVGMLEWINPFHSSRSGRYPYRTGLAAVLTAMDRLVKAKKST